MEVVYATETPPETLSQSMFLAGPSPRNPDHPNWRIEALQLLEELNYEGVVFIPLPRDGEWAHSYVDQVGWEEAYLNMADVIVFWVPRDLETLPAFTTNIEWGKWFDTGKVILGFPEDAPKMRYLDYDAQAEFVPVTNTLQDTLIRAVQKVGSGMLYDFPNPERTGGERFVPQHIWQTKTFQSWYQAQKGAGNRLDGAKLLWSFRVGQTKGFTFCFALHVSVYIAAEDRHKTNEFVISRPDIACIVAYRKPEVDGALMSMSEHIWHDKTVEYLLDTEVILIREFRSPARTQDGFIREIPGGSSHKPTEDPFIVMAHELAEETGLEVQLAPHRIREVGSRQVAGTLSAHQAHAYAIELVDDEWEFLRNEAKTNTVHGVEEDSERTYVEIHRLGGLLDAGSDAVDWSMLGMICTALLQ